MCHNCSLSRLQAEGSLLWTRQASSLRAPCKPFFVSVDRAAVWFEGWNVAIYQIDSTNLNKDTTILGVLIWWHLHYAERCQFYKVIKQIEFHTTAKTRMSILLNQHVAIAVNFFYLFCCFVDFSSCSQDYQPYIFMLTCWSTIHISAAIRHNLHR